MVTSSPSAAPRARWPSRPTSNWSGRKIHARVVINHYELLIVRVWSPGESGEGKTIYGRYAGE